MLHVPSAVPTETIVRNATNHARVTRGRTATRMVKRKTTREESVDRYEKGNLFLWAQCEDPPGSVRDERVGCPCARGSAAVRGFATRAASVADVASRTRVARVAFGAADALGGSVRPSTRGPPLGRRLRRRPSDVATGPGPARGIRGAGRRVRPRARPRRWRRAERSVPARGRRRASRRDAGVDAARRAECRARAPATAHPGGFG